ncbi:helix-turn-helix transcriptional regulator [Lacrimispora sp. 210928-DFI.3.58]|uniref:helix-turn-helix transcriptional regulator n=1 Tax=Lacrimispora sp. 210928-DFI.3.58 TaxID=2883214 RepID=UPI0015B717E8|nr:AraC family transcriptional regulator [Lacrimispora sp. 210928-DFI.3.58]MCB7320561.1 AraC family transcriptional regulator [Lacrimispora sp. 210928-DFI.3.58]
MIVQKITHCTDSLLTQEMARIDLEECQVVVTWFTNQNNKQSVVHSHPYHEIILPISGSDVLYSFLGNLYTLHPGEMVFFPAEIYHAGRYTVTDTVSDRLVVQINANAWDKAIRQSGLQDPAWQKGIVILDANSVSSWDLRGLLERMAQISHIKRMYQETILTCELVELQLFINQIVEEQHTKSPSATSALISTAVEYIREHYTDPNLTAASLAKYTFTSREHLSRAFKEYTMESIHSYINNLRMQNCRREIAAGRSVLDACTNSGFTNYSSFLKSFRTLHGMTPVQYRTQLRSMERKYSTEEV